MQYIYVVKLDNKIHLTVENTSPQELSDAPVYVSSDDATPLDGLVRNLVYSSEETTGCSYIGESCI